MSVHNNQEQAAAGRFHLLLTSDGRAVQHGWRNSEHIAKRKFSIWVGERGTMPGARITLTDEQTGHMVMTWPKEP
ncbi:hypothetical protein SAMN05216532_0043 [Streptomyces sp. 2231.1]|uniref:hypothetical protein n=1 Tax=Streptomyces sp. 2231.1 TaxID=1855347 RepID=UPI000897C2C7|nr:hypothetical protein [Streptomyces sp. 2231.1]SEB96505.1 hypothetical protein SAMN05216532_0043 [Streptomyces sp. 2231.1]